MSKWHKKSLTRGPDESGEVQKAELGPFWRSLSLRSAAPPFCLLRH